MQIGTQIPQTDMLRLLCELLFQAGIRFIELGHEILPTRSGKEVKKFSSYARARGIKIYSVHAPYGKTNDLSTPEEEKRRQTLLLYKETLDKMTTIESNIMIIHPGEKAAKGELETQLKIFRQSLEKLLVIAEEKKITLAIENMPPSYPGNKAKDLRNIVTEFDSPYLGICFDTGHSHLGGKLIQDIETIKGFIVTFHINDNDGIRDIHLQPPYGTINWEAFILAIQGLDYQGPLIMECFPWGGADPRWAKKEVTWLFEGKVCQVKFSPSGYVRCLKCKHFFFEKKGEPLCYCSFKKSLKRSTFERFGLLFKHHSGAPVVTLNGQVRKLM